MINGNAPISELYRLAAEDWVRLDGAARLLEETKTAVLSQMMASLGDMPVSRAELTVKSTDDWKEFVSEMVKARTAANEKKVEIEYLKMRFAEWNSNEANARIERKL
jgi:hypothetical protein